MDDMTTVVACVLVGIATAVLVSSSSDPAARLQAVRGATRRGGHDTPAAAFVGGLTRSLARCSSRILRKATGGRNRADRSAAVSDACVTMAAELAAGRPPPLALRAVADEWPDLFAVPAGHAEIGRSAGPALRQASVTPGAESLVAVAAAWEISERTGARLSDTLLSVADCLRDEAAIRREVQTQLASVRVTARLMAVLPIATLGLFSLGNGGKPVAFLLGTPYGLGCLAAAATFVSFGLLWVERTVRRATRSAWSP